MKTIVMSLALAFSLFSCNAQEKKKPLESAQNDIKKESLKPKGSWRVNKEVDENGNIIRYDSIYSYSYNNLNGEVVDIEDVDSVIQSFQRYFEDRIPQSWNQDFMRPYWSDSIIEENFFQNDFFQNRWKDDLFNIESKMKQIDSIRNQFFKQYHPGLLESTKQEKVF